MSATEFRSVDGRFGLTLPASALEELHRLCLDAGEIETGGIIVGFYTADGDTAFVTRVTGPPKDSKSGPTWFHRGTQALNEQLAKHWSKGEFYLGEWHYHPGGAPPAPSPQDCKQLQEIASSNLYHCPEPVLVVASTPTKEELSVAAVVFPRGRARVALGTKKIAIGDAETRPPLDAGIPT